MSARDEAIEKVRGLARAYPRLHQPHLGQDHVAFVAVSDYFSDEWELSKDNDAYFASLHRFRGPRCQIEIHHGPAAMSNGHGAAAVVTIEEAQHILKWLPRAIAQAKRWNEQKDEVARRVGVMEALELP